MLELYAKQKPSRSRPESSSGYEYGLSLTTLTTKVLADSIPLRRNPFRILRAGEGAVATTVTLSGRDIHHGRRTVINSSATGRGRSAKNLLGRYHQ